MEITACFGEVDCGLEDTEDVVIYRGGDGLGIARGIRLDSDVKDIREDILSIETGRGDLFNAMIDIELYLTRSQCHFRVNMHARRGDDRTGFTNVICIVNVLIVSWKINQLCWKLDL